MTQAAVAANRTRNVNCMDQFMYFLMMDGWILSLALLSGAAGGVLQPLTSLRSSTSSGWKRTRCGSPASNTDIISEYGATVTPENVQVRPPPPPPPTHTHTAHRSALVSLYPPPSTHTMFFARHHVLNSAPYLRTHCIAPRPSSVTPDQPLPAATTGTR
jgi:hypothetical protein